MSDEKAGTGLSQAEFIQMPFDPMMFVFPLSLSRIEAQLQEILNLQKQIMNYLLEQERAKQRSNLIMLVEIQSELKHHWHNPSYRQNKHILVQEIKREANQGILYHRNEIKKVLQKKPLFIRNKEIEQHIQTLSSDFKEYQLNTYLYGFSSYLELVLLGDFQKEYVAKVKNKLSEYSFAYRQLYTESYNYLEKLSQKSLEMTLTSGLKAAEVILKEIGEKVSVKLEIKESSSDFFLLEKQEGLLQDFTENKQSSMDVFASQIQVIEDAYQKEQLFYLDEKHLFLKKNRPKTDKDE